MTYSSAATNLFNRHHYILILDDRCPFCDNNYIVSFMHASNRSHSTKTSPPNQLTQATLGFLHHCQHGRAVPCYVFFLFSTMEQSFFLCLDTDHYAQYTLYALYAPFMPSQGCDELILIPIMPHAYLTHGHSSYLHVCKFFGLYLLVTDFLPSYKNLAYKINLIFYWFKFFEALKLRFELEKLINKFILDLAKFQVNFLLEDFNFYFLNDFKMNLDFKFIKFPVPYLSKLTFIKFPMKSRIHALNLGQFHFNEFHNPILQLKVQTLSVRSTSNLTSHGLEAIGSTSEYSRTLNLRTQKEANKPFNLIKFPVTPGHTINLLKLTDPKQD